LKIKALFQIFLIVGAMFSISLVAEPVKAQQKVCCEQTTSGDFCQYTTADNCAQGSLQAPTNCEQTSFCKLGCGYDNNDGRCFKNTPRAACNKEEGCFWSESKVCDIPQCQKGCCILSNECSFTTQLSCRNEAGNYPGLNYTFDTGITTEAQCIDTCRSAEKGACVSADGSCKFATRESCIETSETIQPNATKINPNVGFHPEVLCSNPQLGTNCASQQYTSCLPDKDEVYWFDSCGNPENIYSSNKVQSYNRGFVLPKTQSCAISGPNDKNCGNCDFVTGTLCGLFDGRENKPAFGDYSCQDLSCDNTDASQTSPSSLTDKKLGESWCDYDSLVGFGLDPVGSRHFRKLCINGKILTEACKDFREEMCIQGVQGQPPLSNPASVDLIPDGSEYVEAACRDNRWQTCESINDKLKDIKPEDIGDGETNKLVSRAKSDCENIQARDCQWIGNDEYGKCIPFVPPGLKFWPGEGENAVPAADATAQCDKGSSACKVVFERPGIGLFEGRDWKCVQGCECLEKDYLRSSNDVCKSYGDCGAYVNYIGEGTVEGLTENSKHDITDADIAGYKEVILPNDKNRGQYQNKFNAFFSKTWPALTVIGAGLLISNEAFGLFTGTGHAFIRFGAARASEEVARRAAVEALKNNHVTNNEILKAAGDQAAAAARAGTTEAAKAAGQAARDAAIKSGIVDNPANKALLDNIRDEAAKNAAQTAGVGTLQTVMSVINIISTIYTIYSLLDILLADTKTETISVTCNPWVAPLGGESCEDCGKDGKPCSEYRCKSLGQLCQLVNEGTKEEACINQHPNDVNTPIISANRDVLEPGQTITEVSRAGFKINEKIEPFTPVNLGLITNEPAVCKYSLETNKKYEEKDGIFGSPNYVYNHTQLITLPGELAENQTLLKLTNGGEYTLYVRCQDASGNANERDYYVKFAVRPGPDLTPPKIEVTSIANNAFIAANTTETNFKAYVNEPSQCRWSTNDIEYDLMTSEFTCSTSTLGISSVYAGLYECDTTLTGLKANQKNTFYFRCKDKPSKPDNERNVNVESYMFSLSGTVPLEITSITPSGQLFENSPTLKVTTAKGAENGKARCGYSTDNNVNNAVEFATTNSVNHEQPFTSLESGSYTYYAHCIDAGGNLETASTTFTVTVDNFAPVITKIYTKATVLHIELNEKTKCEYSNTGAISFGEGTPMTGDDTKVHEAVLDSSVYYVVCKDLRNNVGNFRIYP